MSDYSKALKLDPDNASTFYFRGSVYYVRSQFDKAISDYNNAIQLNREYVNKMPVGVTVVRKQGDIDYSSYVTESLKWHHGSLPLPYWEIARMENTASRKIKSYQIKKK